jgi:hypothetical protein
MNLDDFIITWLCWLEESLTTLLEGKRLRTRGLMPKRSDSEVLTIEVVGS